MAEFTGTGYIPLPSSLHIKDSPIHGQGLFAKTDINSDTELGESHVFLMQDWDGEEFKRKEWLRTALGAFINHSDTPNCQKIEVDGRYFIQTLRDIKEGEELTLKYTLYNV